MKNKPLTTAEQGKVALFCLLLFLTCFVGAGILPALSLIYGVIMMKRSNDFGHIETSLKLFTTLILIGLIGITTIILIDYPYISAYEIQAMIMFWGGGLFSILLARQMYYVPLRDHHEWVELHGIFSSRPNDSNLASKFSGLSIIKREKLKQFSVADELTKWANLREAGHISEADFNEIKNKLLEKQN